MLIMMMATLTGLCGRLPFPTALDAKRPPPPRRVERPLHTMALASQAQQLQVEHVVEQ